MAELTKTYTDFDGLLKIEMCTFTSHRSELRTAGLRRAVPESASVETESEEHTIYLALWTLVGFARQIRIKRLPDDAPEALVSFRDWWYHAEGLLANREYAALWESWLDVHNDCTALMLKAYNKTRRDYEPAPDELKNGSSARAKAEPDFLHAATPVSTPT